MFKINVFLIRQNLWTSFFIGGYTRSEEKRYFNFLISWVNLKAIIYLFAGWKFLRWKLAKIIYTYYTLLGVWTQLLNFVYMVMSCVHTFASTCVSVYLFIIICIASWKEMCTRNFRDNMETKCIHTCVLCLRMDDYIWP